MELMSSLLLCALFVLPLALPQPQTFRGNVPRYAYNNSVAIEQNKNNRYNSYKMMVNVHAPRLVEKPQEAVKDSYCFKQCSECMDIMLRNHNIKRSGSKEYIRSYLPDMHDAEIMKHPLERHRDKRGVQTLSSKSSDSEQKKGRKIRSKNKKSHKSVTVTKFNINGEVYALKVKESNSGMSVDGMESNSVATCQVYSVKKSYPCESPEGYMILAASKSKINQNEEETSTIQNNVVTPEKPGSSSYRKRNVDNTQIPENVMPSMEDFE